MGSRHMVFLVFLLGLIHISLTKTCSGCERDHDVTDHKLTQMLDSTLSRYTVAPQGTDNEQIKLVKIKKVSTQVVSGIKYSFDFEGKGLKTQKLYECQLVLLSQKWREVEQVIHYSCNPFSSSRTKRAVLGGEYEIDIEHYQQFHSLQEYVGSELNKQEKAKYLLNIVKVLRATQQVVNGLLTKLTVEVAETNCLLNEKSSGICESGLKKTGRKICNIEIWEKPWLQEKKVSVKDCKEIPYFCAGCPIEINPDDEQANQCLKRTLFNLNTKSHSQKEWKLLRVVRIQSQVVAGIKYSYDFEAEDEKKALFMCRAVIVSQPWISKEPLLDDFDCVPESH